MSDLELELRIGAPQGGRVRVDVLQSPAGEASTTTTLPFDGPGLESRLKDLQLALLSRSATRRRLVPEHEQAVMRFGQELFDAVFTGEVRSLLDRSRDHATTVGAGLRIQLRFDSGDLASLPWEFLHDARCNEYLALSRATPIVRYVQVAQPQRPLRTQRPLRLLAMVASPSDLPHLDVAQERARIETALAPVADQIELHWLEGQTWRHLQEALQAETWHAFHFVGHGGFDGERGEGVVALCDEAGASHRLSATELGILLGDHDSLRLAVLNSCDGARTDKLDVFTSTAAVLVQRGTPAVIAMQYEITDDAAVELSRAFYAAIAQGLPVDAALTEARKAVALALPGTVEWGTPVLYLRAPDGRIFDLPPAPPPRAGAPPPPPAGVALVGPPPRRRFPRAAVVAAGIAAVVAVVLLGALLFGGGSEPEPVGLGRHLVAASTERVGVHRVEVPEGSAVLLRADPVDDFDPDVAVVTRRVDARALERYLGGAGFDADAFNGALDHYGGVPAGRVVARTDEGAGGEPERLAFLAPFGGAFDLVVGAADGVAGEARLDVRLVELGTPERGEELVDLALDSAAVRASLSELGRADMADMGAVNVVPHLEDADVPSIDSLLGADLLGELDEGTIDCILAELDDVFSSGTGEATSGASEDELQGVVSDCGGGDVTAPRPFADAVAARLAADGVVPPGTALDCPSEAALSPWTVWFCRSSSVDPHAATWVVVLDGGRWAYDHGPELVRSVGEIAPPGQQCRDVQERGWSYFYAVLYWLAEGRPARLDADGNGIPCETLYPPDDVARLWG